MGIAMDRCLGLDLTMKVRRLIVNQTYDLYVDPFWFIVDHEPSSPSGLRV